MLDIKEIENTIINADCMDILKQFPDNSIDLVITDPPYTFVVGGIAKKRNSYKKMMEWSNGKINWYNEKFLKELCRVCKNNNIVLFCQRTNLYDILHFAKNNNLNFGLLPILKNNPTPLTNQTWLSNEYAVSLYKNSIVLNTEYLLKIPYFFVTAQKQPLHPNEKNLRVFERILKNISNENDLILDCFSGSGTTAVACHNLKRRFICIEKDYDYWKASVERLENAKAQMRLF